MSQILKTNNYDLFKIMAGNRSLDAFHIRKLTKAIEEDNQLSVHPIIINKDFFVIDGQHRLQCAKSLGLEIYYIQSDSVTDYHVIAGNVNQKSFELNNYIDYFAIKDRLPQYILLKSRLQSSGLKPKAFLTLTIGTVSISLLEFLKTGKFRFPSSESPVDIIEFYMDFSAYIKDKRIKPFSMFSNHNFTKALRWLFKTNGFDRSVFFKKLDVRWFELKPQRTSEEWYFLLIGIYNYRNQNKIEDESGA